MRRALACLLTIVALAALASAPVSAQMRSRPMQVIPPTPTRAPTPEPEPAPNPILRIPIPLAAGRQGLDPDQCRTSCAKTYYFCRATPDDDGCATQWAQCKSRCTATYTRLGG